MCMLLMHVWCSWDLLKHRNAFRVKPFIFIELPSSAELYCIKAFYCKKSVLSIKVPCFNMKKCSSHLQTVLSLLKKKIPLLISCGFFFSSLRLSLVFYLSTARGHYGYTSETQKLESAPILTLLWYFSCFSSHANICISCKNLYTSLLSQQKFYLCELKQSISLWI